MALRTNSPAIDAVGTNTATFPATDQRGIGRPLGKGADIGAYELATSPGIITQPQSQSQSFGGSVTFTVDAAGASLRYQWQFGSSNIPAATASSYTLSNINVTNAGGYRVVACEFDGESMPSRVTDVLRRPSHAEHIRPGFPRLAGVPSSAGALHGAHQRSVGDAVKRNDSLAGPDELFES